MKNNQFAISEFFCDVVHAKRKQLWDIAKSRREDGDKVSLRCDTYLFSGTKCVCNAELNLVGSQKLPRKSNNDNVSFLVINCRSNKNKSDNISALADLIKLSITLGT